MTQQDDITQPVLTAAQRKEFIRRASYISETDRDTRAAFVEEIARAALASAPVAGEAVYTLRVRGAIQAWTPTAAAFSIPDGEHQLFLSPAAPQASAEDVRNAMRNLIWAASERDKGNRIRQFDQFMDEARVAISLDAANQGSRDE